MTYWQGKVAIVTGGSGGLGREIARVLGRHGAQVTIAARRIKELSETAAELTAQGCCIDTWVTDVTNDESVAELIRSVIRHHGRIDMVVNNAGRSARRAVLDATPDEFRELFDLNLLSAVRMTRATASHLIATRGHLVNIGSLAGKTATRFMGAYPATKFALSAYTQQVRLELESQGLHVLLVCPGPIARDQQRETPPGELAGLPPEAARPGAGAKVRAVRPERLAEMILTACEHRRKELVVPAKARLLFALAQLSPKLGDWILRRST